MYSGTLLHPWYGVALHPVVISNMLISVKMEKVLEIIMPDRAVNSDVVLYESGF
jgi:hypothetical protein